MAKPTKLPRWADAAPAGAIVEPNEGKKDVGWKNGERPPSQFFNWWMSLVYQWTSWLDSDVGESATFTPILQLTPQPTYTIQLGRYTIVGRYCHATFDIEWQNDDDPSNATQVSILLPYINQSVGTDQALGPVYNTTSDFGTQSASATQWNLRADLSGAVGVAEIFGASNPGDAPTSIVFGDSEVRRVSGEIWYPHNNTGLYGAETPNR